MTNVPFLFWLHVRLWRESCWCLKFWLTCCSYQNCCGSCWWFFALSKVESSQKQNGKSNKTRGSLVASLFFDKASEGSKTCSRFPWNPTETQQLQSDVHTVKTPVFLETFWRLGKNSPFRPIRKGSEFPKNPKKIFNLRSQKRYSRWWLNQPIWRILVKLESFPQGWKFKKYLSWHHPVFTTECLHLFHHGWNDVEICWARDADCRHQGPDSTTDLWRDGIWGTPNTYGKTRVLEDCGDRWLITKNWYKTKAVWFVRCLFSENPHCFGQLGKMESGPFPLPPHKLPQNRCHGTSVAKNNAKQIPTKIKVTCHGSVSGQKRCKWTSTNTVFKYAQEMFEKKLFDLHHLRDLKIKDMAWYFVIL